MNKVKYLFALCMLFAGVLWAQDSVDVTFTYTTPGAQTGVQIRGEFTNWGTNPRAMTNVSGNLYAVTVRLAATGQPGGGVGGAYQYKFYYTGVSDWPNDPLNHHVNTADNSNSFIRMNNPTIFHFLPNQRQAIVNTGTPTISAFLYPRVGGSVDTSTIQLKVDGTTYSGLGQYFNAATSQLSYTLPSPIANGSHTAILHAGTAADTVTFITQAGYVQITTQGGYTTLSPQRTLRGIVQNISVPIVKIVRNNTDTTVATTASGAYAATINLVEGVNTFKTLADSAGTLVASSPVTFTRYISHSPSALIGIQDLGGSIQLSATGSTDPDSGQAATLTFQWSEDPSNPAPIGGINGNTSSTISIARPAIQGEYYFGLVATDVNGNKDTTRNYFLVGATPPVAVPTVASVPAWVRQGRMYSMFFKMHTAAGTINAAYPDLDRIAAMGYNIIWVLPVMTNRDPINNGTGPGYNIVDFYNVAPEYGTNQDFINFTTRAHQLGMKVILDVTPNHTSSSHPFVLDARSFTQNSRYWTYYEHQFIPYSGVNIGNLSESITSDGFVYYGGFSDALLNYNWADLDARQYMLNVYKYWIQHMGVDGYRLDVYWGPHIRANSPNGGENEMGRPMRQFLKHVRPDIHLLGEASGTGTGTEVLYADYYDSVLGSGGVESAYDWNLKGFIQNDATFWTQSSTNRVNTLDSKLRNGSSTAGMGYLPGPNSYFMRFLENQDEDRVIYVFGQSVDSTTAAGRTMCVSTAVNLAVGMPMVYAGQEVGRGIGISNLDTRRRGVINWNNPLGLRLSPHYQKLAQIRKQFACFTTQKMVRVTSSVPGVYAYTRPYAGANGIVVTNMEGNANSASIMLVSTGTTPGVEGVTDGVQYVLTDLYNGNTRQNLTFTGGSASFTVNLPAFGTAVFVLADSGRTLVLPPLTSVKEVTAGQFPKQFSLSQNYPNPFNPATTIKFQIPNSNWVSFRVFDILGREVTTLVNEQMQPGSYEVTFEGKGLASGVYFYRLNAGSYVDMKKMVLTK